MNTMDTKDKAGLFCTMISFGIIFGFISAGTYALGMHYDVQDMVQPLMIAGLVPSILMYFIGFIGTLMAVSEY